MVISRPLGKQYELENWSTQEISLPILTHFTLLTLYVSVHLKMYFINSKWPEWIISSGMALILWPEYWTQFRSHLYASNPRCHSGMCLWVPPRLLCIETCWPTYFHYVPIDRHVCYNYKVYYKVLAIRVATWGSCRHVSTFQFSCQPRVQNRSWLPLNKIQALLRECI